jgi:hypothetical protein
LSEEENYPVLKNEFGIDINPICEDYIINYDIKYRMGKELDNAVPEEGEA